MAAGAAATLEVDAGGPTEGGSSTIRVHVIRTGRNVANERVMRGGMASSFIRRRQWIEFPVQCFLVEHPEGLLVIDTGLSTRVRIPGWQHRILGIPSPLLDSEEEEIGPQMRSLGLAPEDVRRVVLTHLDVDHAGGVAHFPGAEILVHRPEFEYASKTMGRFRYQPELWPSWFSPTVYDLEADPYGPFPESRSVTERGDVRLVPLPGHSIGQVGVVVETDRAHLFFAADHVLRQDWCVQDFRSGNLQGLAFFPKLAPATTRRIQRFTRERPVVLVPSHDADAPARLEAVQTVCL
jgi:N-acyl homoserine lactone hydrolase